MRVTFNDWQSNKLMSLKAVRDMLITFRIIAMSVPAFQAVIDRLIAKILQICSMGQTKDEAREGKTDAKENSENELIDAYFRMRGSVKNFAKETKNFEVLAFLKLNRSTLKRMRDVLIYQKAAAFYKILDTNRLALVEYGITDVMISTFQDLMTSYDNLIGSKESSFAQSEAATKLLKQYFTEAEDILDSLDGFMDAYSKSHPLEYEQYKAARAVKDLGVRHDEDTPPSPPQNPA